MMASGDSDWMEGRIESPSVGCVQRDGTLLQLKLRAFIISRDALASGFAA